MGNELDVKAISREKREVEKYMEDPLIHSKISPNYSIKFAYVTSHTVYGSKLDIFVVLTKQWQNCII